MEALPPKSRDVRWTDYRIATPSFDLTPVEKPDMSPFLIHMTGKEAIHSILNGENSPNELADREGFLRSAIPSQSADTYEAQVVCFTETPTFALDFFRYRSYARWRDDLRFGIGFSKTELITRGVRPVMYVDHELLSKIMALREVEPDEDNQQFSDLVETLYRFSTPLLERKRDQGFIWEREWRFPDDSGLVFHHSDVRVICCPPEEQAAIQQVLGEHAGSIKFVNSWKEYSDVTAFLERQEKLWSQEAEHQGSTSLEGEIGRLLKDIQKRKISLNSLKEYEANLLRAETELLSVREKMERSEKDLDGLSDELKRKKKEKRVKDAKEAGKVDDDGIPF